MKNKTLLLTGFSVISLLSCNNPNSKADQDPTEELKVYVDSVKTLSADSTENWPEIERGFQNRLSKAEALTTSEEGKKEIEESKENFNSIRVTNNPEPETNSTTKSYSISPERRSEIRNSLFGQGKVGDDIKFDWITSTNILSVYEGFVANVKANKDSYSREDWDEVKVLYEALDTRKNEVESTLSTKDNLQIAKRKIEFASYNTTERPMSKAQENEDAKQ